MRSITQAFQQVRPAKALAQAVAPARPIVGRVLRDAAEEALEAWKERIAPLPRELNHRQRVVVRQIELAAKPEVEDFARVEALSSAGVSVEDEVHLTFVANFKTHSEWSRPGPRQDVITKRYKRFGSIGL